MSRVDPPKDTTRLYSEKEKTRIKIHPAGWIDTAKTQPMGVDVWLGMRPPMPRELVKVKFENSSIHSNGRTKLAENVLVFY